MSGVVNQERKALDARSALRLGLLLLASAGAGAASGVLWWAVVRLPAYRVNSDGGASTTERGLTEVIGADAWFCAIGLVFGVLLGTVAWRRFRSVGWGLVAVVVVCSIVAALLCWLVGYRLGPGEFAPRLAAAKAGDVVPIELTLQAKASLMIWPFFAVLPVLLGSSLGRDHDAAEGPADARVEPSQAQSPPLIR